MPAVTIKLNDVKKGDVVFKTMDLMQSSKTVEEHYAKMNPDKKPLEYEVGETNHSLVDAKTEFRNAFIATALCAYNNHLPLEWTPDDIWSMIALGVAQHLGGDKDLAETYRKVFVDHQGKKELIVDGTKIIHGKNPVTNKTGWPIIIERLCALIKKSTKTDLADFTIKPFSTSGPIEISVYHCMLMETMKNYFAYTCVCMCGIPEVTLHGSVEDWQSILQRLQDLNKIFPDFAWYLNRVSNHVTKLLAVVNGEKPDLEWWNTMVLEEPLGSGGQTQLTGWLSDFIPYIFRDNGKRCPNRGNIDFDHLNSPAVALTDFKLNDNGAEYDMKLCGGFIGVSQDKTTKAVRPVLGWTTYYVQ